MHTVRLMNGNTSRIGATLNGNSSRISSSLNGNTSRIGATLNGRERDFVRQLNTLLSADGRQLNGFLKKMFSGKGKKRRTAKRRGRRGRRATRQQIRMRNREEGTTFFDKVGDALKNFAGDGFQEDSGFYEELKGYGVEASPEDLAQNSGVVGGLIDMAKNDAEDEENEDMTAMEKFSEFFTNNWMWLVPVALGLGYLGYKALVPTKPKRRR